MSGTIERGLTEAEAAILNCLVQAGGNVVRKEALHAALQADTGSTTPKMQIVDVHICRLRRKLPPQVLRTRWGLGYRLTDPEAGRALLGELAQAESAEVRLLRQAMREALAACEAQKPAEAALLLMKALPEGARA